MMDFPSSQKANEIDATRIGESASGWAARLRWLQPLFAPHSLAIIGATDKPDTVGRQLVIHAGLGGFSGPVWPVNTRLHQIEGRNCFPSAADLPHAPDLAILAVSDQRVEAAAEEAIAAGARALIAVGALASDPVCDPPRSIGAAVASDSASGLAAGHIAADHLMLDHLMLDHLMLDPGAALKHRLATLARAAGIPLLGGNSMGVYRFDLGLWACGFPTRNDHRPGSVTLITQSGSVFNALVDSDARIDFNFIVSPGQELDVTMEDAFHQALALQNTRAIGLFIETARRPHDFRAALELAAERNIPVVAIKVGRSAEAKRLAVSHSGAMTGNDDAWNALFKRYGVLRAHSLDEMATILIMLSAPRKAARGGLATIHDSGGERGLLLDLASDRGVPFAAISSQTASALKKTLDPGLPPVNPLDAWGRGYDYEDQFTELLSALAADDATAIAAVIGDRGPDGDQFNGVLDVGARVFARCDKPVFVVANHQGTGKSDAGIAMTRRGVPVLDGIPVFLSGVVAMLATRDSPEHWRTMAADRPPEIAVQAVKTAQQLALEQNVASEAHGLALLHAADIPVVEHGLAGDLDQVLAVAHRIGFPVVLKTAAAGILHKSDRGGVRLAIADPNALAAAYGEMSSRLGPDVLVARMVDTAGVEIILGAAFDPQWGPVVSIGMGGIHAELLGDITHALPPFGPQQGRDLLAGLRLYPLLEGRRGQPPADIGALANAISRFSALTALLGETITEFDVNPLLAMPQGCVALDAMVATKPDQTGRSIPPGKPR